MIKFKGLGCVLFSLMMLCAQAWAQGVPLNASGVAPLETAARQAILIDGATGTVLFEKEADTPMPTSSMSKLMTMYEVFKALKEGKLTLDSSVTISEQAWRQEGSRMFANLGQQVRIEDLIRGVVVQSGNDAAVALAEAVGGSEGSCVALMNSDAQRLGMTHSHFMNATGLPDPAHYSTARDLAILAMALLRDFPAYYHYFAELNFTYNNIKQGNRNPLLYRGIGVDGFKTGHTEAAGFGLVASSLRAGRRMFMVVNGLGSMQARADEPAKILDWGYREYGLFSLYKKDAKVVEASVWAGEQKTVPLVAEQEVAISLPHALRPKLQVKVSYAQPLPAPLEAGQKAGEVILAAPGIDRHIPLLVGASVPKETGIALLMTRLRYIFGVR